MQHYPVVLSILTLSILLILALFVSRNHSLKTTQRHGLLAAFIATSIVVMCEMLGIILNGSNLTWRGVHVMVNFLGFGVSPWIPLFMVFAIHGRYFTKKELSFFLAYNGFSIVSLIFGLIFKVDANNVYHRGPLFLFYIVFYIISTIYLFYQTIRMVSKFQRKGGSILLIIGIYTFFAVFVQIFIPQIQVAWLSITIILIMYYLYCISLWFQMDGLTDLLDQSTYLSDINQKKDMTLILFDIDSFKNINDTYGHLEGDRLLKFIANLIREVFSDIGYCYRVGGDEFAVIILSFYEAQREISKFNQLIRNHQSLYPDVPAISIGIAQCGKDDSKDELKERADASMYLVKRTMKYHESFPILFQESHQDSSYGLVNTKPSIVALMTRDDKIGVVRHQDPTYYSLPITNSSSEGFYQESLIKEIAVLTGETLRSSIMKPYGKSRIRTQCDEKGVKVLEFLYYRMEVSNELDDVCYFPETDKENIIFEFVTIREYNRLTTITLEDSTVPQSIKDLLTHERNVIQTLGPMFK